MTRLAPLAVAALLLAGCAVIPTPDPTPPQAQGYAVPLGVPVRVGGLVVTPKKLVEDSRCPADARCVWAGRVVVTTRIAGDGWADTADLTLGEPYGTHGRVIALARVRPDKTAQSAAEPRVYRFVYEMR